jgi:hypothetical protein
VRVGFARERTPLPPRSDDRRVARLDRRRIRVPWGRGLEPTRGRILTRGQGENHLVHAFPEVVCAGEYATDPGAQTGRRGEAGLGMSA